MELENVKLCDYGCGQEATHQLGNGKWCCSKKFQGCSVVKKKRHEKPNKKSNKLNPYARNKKKEKPEFCEYRCGEKAAYYFKTTNTWCCSESYNNCKTSRRQRSKTMLSEVVFENINHVLCDHGCGQLAKYKSKSGKYRCSKQYKGCPEIIKIKPVTWNKRLSINPPEEIVVKNKKTYCRPNMIEVTSGICDYGCGKEAKFKSSYGKLCCEKMHMQCSEFRKRNSERMKINNPMKNPFTVQKNFKNHNRQKTGPEKYLENVFKDLNLEILYIGNGTKYINGRSPDFIIPNTKKLIETYDSTFTYSGEIRDENWIEKRRKQLYGYDVLFIDTKIYGGIKNLENLTRVLIEFYFK